MQALILAAGRGSRLGRFTADTPKCLLPIGGRPLIEHQLDALSEAGVDQVALVVGYRADQVRRQVGPRVGYLRNPRWSSTNSLYSFWLARDWVQGPLLVLNSDILFQRSILDRLLREPGDRIAYDSSSGYSPEDMSVKVADGRLVEMSKDLPEKEVSGENVGMLCFTAATARSLFVQAGALVAAGRQRDWLALAVRQVAQQRLIRAVDIRGLPWQEIDFPDDLHRARQVIYPLIGRPRQHARPLRLG